MNINRVNSIPQYEKLPIGCNKLIVIITNMCTQPGIEGQKTGTMAKYVLLLSGKVCATVWQTCASTVWQTNATSTVWQTCATSTVWQSMCYYLILSRF